MRTARRATHQGDVRIRVLGSVEVERANSLIPLAGQRQRALLAALTMDHGKVVPVDYLIDVLWDQDPPPSARAKIQSHVSALRRALGYGSRAGEGALVTKPSGYVLLAADIQLDLAEFGWLTARGREASAHRRWAEASALFGEALSLWRGPAYADVMSRAVRSAAAALEENRLLAAESKAEADLALGHYEVIVAELSGQLVRHPLRERLRVQLMRALYQLGSRADALALYRAGRRAMIDELGLEPSQELRELHQSILAGHPAPMRKLPDT